VLPIKMAHDFWWSRLLEHLTRFLFAPTAVSLIAGLLAVIHNVMRTVIAMVDLRRGQRTFPRQESGSPIMTAAPVC
jgi:hypothetical protein